MSKKARSGQPAGKIIRSARGFNRAQEAAENYEKRQRLGVGIDPYHSSIPSDLIKVRNNSGATRLAGQVLAVDGNINSILERERLWLEGDLPASRYDPFCVLHHRTPNGAIGVAQVSGVCVARVGTSGDVADNRAYISTASPEMTSDKSGPIQILWQPASASSHECIVLLGRELVYKYVNVYFDGTYATNADVVFFNAFGIYPDAFTITTGGIYLEPVYEVGLSGMYLASMSATLESVTAPDGARLTLTLLVNGVSPVGTVPCRAAREQMIRYDTYGAPVQYSAENVAFSRVIKVSEGDQIGIRNTSAHTVIVSDAQFTLHYIGRYPQV